MAAITERQVTRATNYARWESGTTQTTTLHGFGQPKEGRFGVLIVPRGSDVTGMGAREFPVVDLSFTPAFPKTPKAVDEMLDMTDHERRLAYGSRILWTSAADPRHQAGEYLIGVDQPSLTDMGLVDPGFNIPVAADNYLTLPPRVRASIAEAFPAAPQTQRVSKEEAEDMRILLQAGVESMPGATSIVDAIEGWIDEKVQQALEDLSQAAQHPWQTAKWLVDRYIDTPPWVERPKAPWKR